MTPANKAALAEIDEALNDPDTFDNHGDIVQKALEFYRSALTTPAANTGDDIQKPRCKTYCKFGNMDQSRPRLCMDCGHEEGEEAREQLTEILTKAHEKLALQRPEPSEGVKALLARLETGARSNSDAMQCYDSVRESTIEHPGASLPRDIFESFIDSIADDVAALAPRQVDVELYELTSLLKNCRDKKVAIPWGIITPLIKSLEGSLIAAAPTQDTKGE